VIVPASARLPPRRVPQARRAHDQLTVLHALEAKDVVGQVAQFQVRAAQRLHLEAKVVVEMHVEGREHARAVLVSGFHGSTASRATLVWSWPRQRHLKFGSVCGTATLSTCFGERPWDCRPATRKRARCGK